MDNFEIFSRSVSHTPPANTFFSTRAISGFGRLFGATGPVGFDRSKKFERKESSRSEQPKRTFSRSRALDQTRPNIDRAYNLDQDYTNRIKTTGGRRPDREGRR